MVGRHRKIAGDRRIRRVRDSRRLSRRGRHRFRHSHVVRRHRDAAADIADGEITIRRLQIGGASVPVSTSPVAATVRSPPMLPIVRSPPSLWTSAWLAKPWVGRQSGDREIAVDIAEHQGARRGGNLGSIAIVRGYRGAAADTVDGQIGALGCKRGVVDRQVSADRRHPSHRAPRRCSDRASGRAIGAAVASTNAPFTGSPILIDADEDIVGGRRNLRIRIPVPARVPSAAAGNGPIDRGPRRDGNVIDLAVELRATGAGIALVVGGDRERIGCRCNWRSVYRSTPLASAASIAACVP